MNSLDSSERENPTDERLRFMIMMRDYPQEREQYMEEDYEN